MPDGTRACPQCGSEVTGHGTKVYCSTRCRRQAERAKRPKDVRCSWCDAELVRADSTRAYSCDMECAHAYRMWRNGNSSKPWPRVSFEVTLTCRDCGETWTRRGNSATMRPQPRCRDCREAERRAKAEARDRERAYRPRFIAGVCLRCGDAFVMDRQQFDNGNRYCSKQCSKRASHDRRRARKRGAYVEDVRRAEVFARDNYTCHICGKPLAMGETAPHPKSPTIDHLWPLALGGTHEPSNVRAAHFLCNSRRGDRVEAQQMVLAV